MILSATQHYDPRKLGADCDHCPRREQEPVPPEGNPKAARAVWLGQDPGEQEVIQGRPFVGPTGVRTSAVWLAACHELGIMPIPRSEVFITNTSLCQPVTRAETEAGSAAICCRPRLMKELAQLRPGTGILAMGKRAFFTLTGLVKTIEKHLGFHFWIARPKGDGTDAKDLRLCSGDYYAQLEVNKSNALWIEPVTHPAFTFRRPADLGPLQAHIVGFIKRVARGFPPEPLIRVNPPAALLRELVARCKQLRKGMAVDIETAAPIRLASNNDPRCRWALIPRYAKTKAIGVGADIDNGIGYSWSCPPPPDVWQAFKRACADLELVKVLQNGLGFDVPALGRLEVRFLGIVHDTRDFRRAYSSTSRLGLGQQAAIHLVTWPWKTMSDFTDKDR